MRRAITAVCLCVGIVALIAPGASAGPGNGKGKGVGAQAKACAKLKKADRAAFRATYGPKQAMKKCIRGDAPKAGKVVKPKALKNAAQECRAERSEDADAFRETYGTNANKRNAFGKCVVTKVRDRKADEGGSDEGGKDGTAV